jgi:hypothetical protein
MAVRMTQEINDSGETFSIDMLGRPTANHLENFESDQDKALLMFYENSHDHVGDLIQNLDDASPGYESNIAGQRLLNTLKDMKITPNVQGVIQQRFNSLQDRNGLVIGCCCCGCTTILPTVSESGSILPTPILSVFPTDPKFNPLKFTPDELTEFNAQNGTMQHVCSCMAINKGLERYHVHQQLIHVIEPPNDNQTNESTSHTTESNDVMEDEQLLCTTNASTFHTTKSNDGMEDGVIEPPNDNQTNESTSHTTESNDVMEDEQLLRTTNASTFHTTESNNGMEDTWTPE